MGKIWKKLKLVVVYSTEIYPTLDTNRSPFNVGLPIDLPEFNQKQIEEMVNQYATRGDMVAIIRFDLTRLTGH